MWKFGWLILVCEICDKLTEQYRGQKDEKLDRNSQVHTSIDGRRWNYHFCIWHSMDCTCSSFKWLIDNQLQDGSWGDPHMFLIREKIINTLACVLALKTWNTFVLGVNQGRSAISYTLYRLELTVIKLWASWILVVLFLIGWYALRRIEFPSDIYSKNERWTWCSYSCWLWDCISCSVGGC